MDWFSVASRVRRRRNARLPAPKQVTSVFDFLVCVATGGDMEFSYVNSHAYSSYMRDAISSHVAQVFNSTDQHILASQSSC